MTNISVKFEVSHWQQQLTEWDLSIILLLFEQKLGNCTQRSEQLIFYKNCRENMEMKRNIHCVWMRVNISKKCLWNLSVVSNFSSTISTTVALFLQLCATEFLLLICYSVLVLIPPLTTLSHLTSLPIVFIACPTGEDLTGLCFGY